MGSFVISAHAQERYRIFYPQATISEIRKALTRSIKVKGQDVNLLLGRRSSHLTEDSIYYMHAERTGIFVAMADKTPYGKYVITTFLRLYSYQQYCSARKLWPGAVPPTTEWFLEAVRPEEFAPTILLQLLAISPHVTDWMKTHPPGPEYYRKMLSSLLQGQMPWPEVTGPLDAILLVVLRPLRLTMLIPVSLVTVLEYTLKNG